MTTEEKLRKIIQEVVNETLTTHNKFLLAEVKKILKTSLNESRPVQQPRPMVNPYSNEVYHQPVAGLPNGALNDAMREILGSGVDLSQY